MITTSDETFSDETSRWLAVQRRDAAADGVFYYAVASTGVYCRPTCPARRPARERVRYFDSPEAAEGAGYRPCRRCEPNQVSFQQQLVAEALRLIEGAETPLTLQDLARRLHTGASHLQRVFKRQTGLTPAQYRRSRRLARLKPRLQNGESITGAMLEAGYASSKAFYRDAARSLGMPPAAYRRGGQGLRIAYATVETSLGGLLVAATTQGVCAVRFGEPGELAASLRTEFPRADLVEDAGAVAAHVEAVLQQLEGRVAAEVPLAAAGSEFQRRVWAALRDIPYGETRSYREVAAMIGEPGAARAVARACATNPLALIVPCHRVVAADGGLGGYRWGVERKRALLEKERSLAQAGIASKREAERAGAVARS